MAVQWLGLQVQSLVRELRSHKPHSLAKKKKKKLSGVAESEVEFRLLFLN